MKDYVILREIVGDCKGLWQIVGDYRRLRDITN